VPAIEENRPTSYFTGICELYQREDASFGEAGIPGKINFGVQDMQIIREGLSGWQRIFATRKSKEKCEAIQYRWPQKESSEATLLESTAPDT